MSADLAALLGRDYTEIEGLSASDAERLAALFVDARARQSQALGDAIQGGLGHIPRLLRGPVKAALFR